MPPQKQAFTLLELIVVIIIVGILASIALPKFSSVIEYTRSTEALTNIGSIRQAIERLYLMSGGDLTKSCLNRGLPQEDFACLGMDDLDHVPNTHFTYHIDWIDAFEYEITATRNTRDGGHPGDTLSLLQVGQYAQAENSLTCGTGVFSKINNSPNCAP